MAANRPPSAEIRPDVWLDARRALWLSAPRLLVVADLHWGYVASHRARGNLLPEWGDAEIAARLESLLRDYEPAEMVWLGDSLHALPGRAAAERFMADHPGAPISVLAGNHDARWRRAGGRSLSRGGFFLHHGDLDLEPPRGHVEIIGHLHPAVSWHDGAGGSLRLPALVDAPGRLILPAFSPWSAGTPWNAALRPGECLWGLSARRIFRLPHALLFPGAGLRAPGEAARGRTSAASPAPRGRGRRRRGSGPAGRSSG
jgi:metallophosphoesterase superfamily enzyme